MKNRFSTILTVLLVIALLAGAVCIGSVKGYKEEREDLLLSCMEMHANAGSNLARSIERCEDAAEDFDDRLEDRLMGRVAWLFGVKPIEKDVEALHAQLLVDREYDDTPDLADQIEELLDDHIDTTLSLSKVFWTVVCLIIIFGKKGRRKGFTLGKLFAGFGLFNMWKKK